MEDPTNEKCDNLLPSRRVGQGSSAMQNVDRAMTKGALWMVLARLSDRSIGFVSTIILVRLLAPADFGLIAMAMSIIAICELLGQVGLEVALIQNPDANRSHYDTAWTIGVILSAITATVLLLVAVPAAKFYGDVRLLPIVLILALGSVISGFENIGIVAFRKELRFNKEFLYIFGKKLSGFLITVPLAFIFRSYWALIAGIVAGRLAGLCLSYSMQNYRPRWSLEARRELFHFSKWMVISNLVTMLNGRAADLIVGKISGAHALGIFNVSFEVSNLPTSELIAPINRAVFPGYARKSTDVTDLRQGYLNVISVIAAFGMPAAFGIAATSQWFVPLLLGDQWLEAAPLISILAFYGILAAMITNAHYVYLALGKPHVAAYLGIGQISLLLSMLAFLVIGYGATGAAYAYLGSQVIFTPFSFAVLFRIIGINARDLLHVIWRPAVSAASMYIIVRLGTPAFGSEPFGNVTGVIHLLAAVAIGITSYLSCLYILWTLSARPLGTESRFLDFVQSTTLWSRFRSALPVNR